MTKKQIDPQTEWLRPSDVKDIFKISHTRFYQLVRDGAFKVSKPDPNGRAVFVRRRDVESFFENGYPKAA